MGVPYYFYQLYRKYNGSNMMIDKSTVSNLNVSHLFLDYNSMIHPCAQQALEIVTSDQTEQIETDIINNCISYTRYVIDTLHPEHVWIMIDGVAPRAKINQQRERRYKSILLKHAQGDNIVWDSNKITPGTDFMGKITQALTQLQIDMKNISKISISDSNTPGEGEHKMMKIINNFDTNTHGKIFIYGLDADLIMLSLLSCRSDNIVLIRDNTFNSKAKESEKTFTYLDISILKSAIYKEVIGKLNNKQIDKSRLIMDYICLCFLLGNDFLEHIPNCKIKDSAVNMLVDIYCNILNLKPTKFLVNEERNQIDIDFLIKIFGELSRHEKQYFSKYKPNKVVYKDTIDLTTTSLEKYFIVNNNNFIQYQNPSYKSRYYRYYNIVSINDAVYNYLEGMHWVLMYYNNHSHNNWSWYYKFSAPPFASDIYATLISIAKVKDNHFTFISDLPNTPIEQLLMVLPKLSLEPIIKTINPDVYNKLMMYLRVQGSSISSSYPDKVLVDMIDREYFWQSKLLFDNFDQRILKQLI